MENREVKIQRREFLRLSGAVMTIAAGRMLAGCGGESVSITDGNPRGRGFIDYAVAGIFPSAPLPRPVKGQRGFFGGINERGEVAGAISDANGITTAALFRNGTVIVIGSNLGGAADINERSQVAFGEYVGLEFRGFIWQNGARQELGTIPPYTFVFPRAINDKAQIVGDTDRLAVGGQAIHQAFLWQNGSFALIGSEDSIAWGINDKGSIVGEVNGRAFLWTPAIPNGTQGTLTTISTSPSTAYDINSIDQVVGRSNVSGVAFLWQNNIMTSLPLLAGFELSSAVAINDLGHAVGFAESLNAETFDRRAVVWRDGKAIDLNILIDPNSGWILEEATDINNAGQIIGRGSLNGSPLAFLLTPT